MRLGAMGKIKLRELIFQVVAVLLLASAVAGARRYRRPDYCNRQARRSSFLWRVDTKPPSYFFGTIHVPYNRVWDHIPENVKRAFHQADAVYFELDLTNSSTVSALTKCQLLPRGARLRQVLPKDIYRRLQNHLAYVRHMMPLWMTADQKGKGLYADYLFNAITGDWQQKRPVWVMLMVNTLTESDVRSRGVPVLDLYLAQEAEKKHKRTGAVERVEEQCLPLNGLNISQVVFALNQTLHQHESIRAGQEVPSYTTDDLIRHYNCGDLDEVIFRRDSSQIPPSVFQVPPLQSAASAAAAAQRLTASNIDTYFRQELIYKRNQRMGERILELLWANPDTSYFFAFGAGHFLGNFTVLDVLRQAGFKVTQVGPRERIRRNKRRRRPDERRVTSADDNFRRRAEPEVGSFRSVVEPPPVLTDDLGRQPPLAQYPQLRVMGQRRASAAPRPPPARPRSALRAAPAPPSATNKYTENFSDLWVRIDDTSKSKVSETARRPGDRNSLGSLLQPSTSSSSAAATSMIFSPTIALLTALLLIVVSVSPPRT